MATTESAYIKVSANGYTVGFSSTMNTSLITRMDFGATYNIKFAGVWVDVMVGATFELHIPPVSATLQLATGPVVDLAELKNEGQFAQLKTNGVNFSKSVAFLAAAPLVGVTAGMIQLSSAIVSYRNGIESENSVVTANM